MRLVMGVYSSLSNGTPVTVGSTALLLAPDDCESKKPSVRCTGSHKLPAGLTGRECVCARVCLRLDDGSEETSKSCLF